MYILNGETMARREKQELRLIKRSKTDKLEGSSYYELDYSCPPAVFLNMIGDI
jgi:hypothetical protein